MNIPYISAEEVRKNLSMEDAIQCTENVYKLKSQDKTVVWPTIFYEFDPGHADMDIKSGGSVSDGSVGAGVSGADGS